MSLYMRVVVDPEKAKALDDARVAYERAVFEMNDSLKNLNRAVRDIERAFIVEANTDG